MNLIASNNLKEIILTEYELITDQIRLKSDHYLDWTFGILPDLANLNYDMLVC